MKNKKNAMLTLGLLAGSAVWTDAMAGEQSLQIATPPNATGEPNTAFTGICCTYAGPR